MSTSTHARILTLTLTSFLFAAWGCSGDDSTSFTSGKGGTAGSGGSSASAGKGGKAGASDGSATGGSGGSAGAAASGGSAGSAAAGGSAGIDGSAGAAGSVGAGGIDGSAGSAGSAGVGGLAGSAGTAGTAGSAGTAGTAGSAGTDGGACPTLILGGANEDVYVDKNAAAGGTGTLQCPFRTIAAASSLAAPGSAVTRRTIHVKGYAGTPDYTEAQAIVLAAKVTLTSNYDASNPGGVATVRIFARGDCTALTGTTTPTFCAVALNNEAVLEKVTVRVTAGAASGHAILTSSVVSSATAPTIVDVIAENAPESGIRVFGSAIVGPRVTAMNNGSGGLNASRGAAVGTAQAQLSVLDSPAASGTPSNNFNNNGGNGLTVFGSVVASVAGMTCANNNGQGIVVGTPYTATTTTTHMFTNVHADNNANNGLRVVSGHVRLVASAFDNTFSNNWNGYGIQATQGDAVGDARLTLEEKKDTGGSYLIAHRANNNSMGGVHLNRATPPGTAPHAFSSLEARQNGTNTNLGSGIFVQIVGANQSSLILRGSTLLANTGAGLRFQKGATNSLDIGTGTAGGFNIWGDATASNRNVKSAICYESSTAVTQAAEQDRWSQACPLPLANATFQAQLTNGCGSNPSYREITYTGASAPIPTVSACF